MDDRHSTPWLRLLLWGQPTLSHVGLTGAAPLHIIYPQHKGIDHRGFHAGAGEVTFAGNVKSIDSRPFVRSSKGQAIRYLENAETFLEIGEVMGRAMAELMEK